MKFKQLRNLIYSPLELIIGDKHLENVEVRDEAFNKYDNYDVIGIRSATHFRSEYYYESNVVISLKPDEEE